MNNSKEEQATLRLDINTLSDRVDDSEGYLTCIDDLQSRVENQEKRSRRTNVILYSVPEGDNESFNVCKGKASGVLNRARDQEQGLPSLGPKENQNP